ncbi:495_t:CDS:2, partial [Gigaspora margarita]
PSPQKRVKITQPATENSKVKDHSQNIQNESRKVGKTTKTPKNQNDITSSSTGIANNNRITQTNDPRKITEVKIKTPITQPKELTELPKPNQLENNHKISDNMETIREMIKEIQPETEVTLLITKYKDIECTVEILKIKFDTSYIPQSLLQLPELDTPEWDLYEYNNKQ